MPTQYVVHYAEVALKGKNRPEFVRVLKRNLVRALSGYEPQVRHSDGRLLLTAEGPEAEVTERIGATFGVSWFSPVQSVPAELRAVRAALLGMAKGAEGTFKIEARRSDKSFPVKSQEMAASLGADVAESTGMKVNLATPDRVYHVDVTRGGAMIYSKRQEGEGGLPVGTAGRVMHLFSGGIDSPVAAWLLMKRGCTPVYLHFYLASSPATPLDSKITRLVRVLTRYGGKSTLVLVPFAEYQLGTAGSSGDLEPSLFRRFMRMTAEALSPWFGASAVSTGDSLSQAASQTLWNLASFDSGSTLPVLRPLLTFDKEEIISIARRIGTYGMSIEEYKDCCAIVTRHPRTRVRAEAITLAVKELGLEKLMWESVEQSTLVSFNPVSGELKSAPLAESIRKSRMNGPHRIEAPNP